MSETVGHNDALTQLQIMPWNLCIHKPTEKIETTMNLDLCCLHICVFNEENRFQLKHQIILLLFEHNWET